MNGQKTIKRERLAEVALTKTLKNLRADVICIYFLIIIRNYVAAYELVQVRQHCAFSGTPFWISWIGIKVTAVCESYPYSYFCNLRLSWTPPFWIWFLQALFLYFHWKEVPGRHRGKELLACIFKAIIVIFTPCTCMTYFRNAPNSRQILYNAFRYPRFEQLEPDSCLV